MTLEPWELFDLRMRRQNKPPTRAKESKFYTDPAKFIEFESERKRIEAEKKRSDENDRCKRKERRS
jgi:hypothetical protein